MSTNKKLNPDRIRKQLEKLEDQVFLKKIKAKQMHKAMINLACELAIAEQLRRSNFNFNKNT